MDWSLHHLLHRIKNHLQDGRTVSAQVALEPPASRHPAAHLLTMANVHSQLAPRPRGGRTAAEHLQELLRDLPPAAAAAEPQVAPAPAEGGGGGGGSPAPEPQEAGQGQADPHDAPHERAPLSKDDKTEIGDIDKWDDAAEVTATLVRKVTKMVEVWE